MALTMHLHSKAQRLNQIAQFVGSQVDEPPHYIIITIGSSETIAKHSSPIRAYSRATSCNSN